MKSPPSDARGRQPGVPPSRLALDSLPWGVLFQSTQGEIRDANPAAARMLGLTLEELRGTRAADLRWCAIREDGSPRPGQEPPGLIALRTGAPVGGSIVSVSGGQRQAQTWLKVSAVPARDPGSGALLGVYSFLEEIATPEEKPRPTSTLETRLQAAFAAMSEGLALHRIVYDATGRPADYRILDVNPAFTVQTGLARESVVGQLGSVAFGGAQAPFLDRYEQVAQSGQSQVFEQYFEPLGRYVQISVFSTEPEYFGTVVKDITERKRAEAALLRQRAMLAQTERIAHIGSWEWEIATDRVRWSEELFRIFGLDPSEDAPSYSEHAHLYVPEDMRRLSAAVDAAMRQGTAYALELCAIRQDGSVRHCLAHGEAERDEDGRITRLIGSLQDITERKRAAEAQRAGEQRLASIFRTIPIGLGLLRERVFVEVNDGFCAMLGYRREDLIGQSARMIYPDDAEFERVGREKYAEMRQTGHGEVLTRFQHKDGRIIEVQLGSTLVDRHSDASEVTFSVIDLSDRKAAERQVRESEQRLRLAQEAGHIGVWDWDLGTDQVYWSPECEQLYGVPAGGLRCSADWRQLVDPQDLADLDAQWSGPIARKEPFEVEYRVRRPDGETRWLISRGQAQYDAAGQPVRLSGVNLDITERKHFVEQLAFLTRRAEVMLALPALAETLDERSFTRAGLRMAEDLTESRMAFSHLVSDDGASIELDTWSQRTLESGCAALYDAHYPLSQADIWADALRTRSAIVINDYAATPDKRGLPEGHAELARLISVPVIDQGSVVMIAAVGNRPSDYRTQDVETLQLIANLIWSTVQRRRTQARLQTLALAVEQSPVAVLITDVEPRIAYVNHAFEQTSGYARTEVLGENPRLLQSGMTPRETYRQLWDALASGQPWRGEFINRRKNGGLYWEIAAIAPVQDSSGETTHYVAVQEDISEKRQLSQELEQHRSHLEELVTARTLELEEARDRAELATRAKSAFLANMSHEIRTPLNAILGLSHLLRRDGVSEAQCERLDKLDGAARHLLGLLNDILDLSKIEAGKLNLATSDFALDALLEEVRSLALAMAQPKGLSVGLDLGNVPSRVHGDAARLRQALLNYLGNAVKFTEHGGILLRARLIDEDSEGLSIRLEVQDSGVGVAPEVLPRLFQAFEQADVSTTRTHGGTGLGLAITRRLIHLMGGEVGVDSLPGQGSTFWLQVRIGRARAPLAPAAAAASDLEGRLRSERSGCRVLLAEDHPINREILSEMLRGLGLQVDTAVDGVEALGKAREQDYALVLMDVRMPNLDGLEATRAIRALPGWSQRPILAMTANALNEDREACLAAGMDDIISKPVEPETLCNALLKWLERPAGPDWPDAEARPLPAEAPRQPIRPVPPSRPELDRLAALPGFDLSRLLAVLNGQPDKLLQLLDRFLARHQDDPARIAAHLSAGERAEAGRITHTLRGVAGNLGAVALAAAVGRLDMALSEFGTSDAASEQASIEEMQEAFQALVMALGQDVHETRRRSVPPSAGGETSAVLRELIDLVSASDTASLRLCETLSGALAARLGEPSFSLLRDRLEHFDFDGALDVLLNGGLAPGGSD